MRPTRLYVGGVLYWTIQTRNPDTLVLKDADSTPTVAVRKNGEPVGDAVTITKRSATTGLYDCSYNPAGEAANDTFQFEELATITGTTTAQATYPNQFVVSVEGAAELDSSLTDQFDDIEAAVDANTGYLTSLIASLSALAGKFAGITLVARWLGLLGGKTADASTRAEFNATTAGATYNETTDSLEAQKDSGGLASSAYEAVVVASMPVGSTVGWPVELIIGDAYRTDTLTAPKLFIRDIEQNVLAGLGSKGFSDADFIGTLRLAPLTDTTKDSSLPVATIEVTTDDSPGIVFNDATADAEYFELQIPHAKTMLGVIKTRYTAQFLMNWGETREFERTVELGEIKFVRKTSAGT